MLYLISVFWFWLLLALVLGLAVGWFTFSREGKGNWGGVVPWLIALAVGVVIAWLKVLPTSVGYWFDVAMLFLASYVAGCLISGLFRGRGTVEEQGATAQRIEPAIAPAKEMAVEPATQPAPVATEATEEAITGLSAARHGKADDLTKIYGVDKETEAKLNALGLYHYDQVAALTPGNRRWLFRHLGYEGRFPSWWWRWRYDAENLARDGVPVAVAATAPPAGPTVAEPMPAADGPTEKPAGLSAPRDGRADDLKRVRGIGKQNEGRLHGLGIWHFDQIAAWNPAEVRWVGAFLAFPGRIEREDWVGQAAVLAKGGETDFSKRADKGLVATSRDDSNDDGQSNVISIDKAKPKAGGKGKPAKK